MTQKIVEDIEKRRKLLTCVILFLSLKWLTAPESGALESAITSTEERELFLRSLNGFSSPGFQEYVYTDHLNYCALRWIIKRYRDK